MLFRTVAILGASLWIGYWHRYSALLELFDGIGCIGTRGSNLVGALAAPPSWWRGWRGCTQLIALFKGIDLGEGLPTCFFEALQAAVEVGEGDLCEFVER